MKVEAPPVLRLRARERAKVEDTIKLIETILEEDNETL